MSPVLWDVCCWCLGLFVITDQFITVVSRLVPDWSVSSVGTLTACLSLATSAPRHLPLTWSASPLTSRHQLEQISRILH